MRCSKRIRHERGCSFTCIGRYDFRLDLFLRLPSHVIIEILASVPAKYWDAFSDVPQLRGMMCELYYFSFYSKSNPNPFRQQVHRAPRSIREFVSDNKGTVRLRYCFLVNSLVTLQRTLKSNDTYMSNACYLCFSFSSIKTYLECLPVIARLSLAFDLAINVTHTESCKELLGKLDKISQVKSLIISDRTHGAWTGIVLPRDVQKLVVSFCDIATFSIPSRVEKVSWRSCVLPNLMLGKVKFPSSLSDLRINECRLPSLNLADLPQSLRSLEISNCQLSTIRFEEGVVWPRRLSYLNLNWNMLNNESFLAIVRGDLPSSLQTLMLRGYYPISFSSIERLPVNVKRLSISLIFWKEMNPQESYKLHWFAESVQALHLSWMSPVPWTAKMISLAIPKAKRLHTPLYLAELTLQLSSTPLGQFIFPSSLVKLTISTNFVLRLSSYEYVSSMGLDHSVLWSQLENLESLDVSQVKVLKIDWRAPPPNLLTILTSDSTDSKNEFHGCFQAGKAGTEH